MTRLFGTDGVRGVANADVTPEIILQIGRALAGRLRSAQTARPVVVVGRDPRPSGDLLAAAFMAGVCSGGVDVHDVGVMPTAGVAYLTRFLQAAAGAVVTASHNPLADNGLKLFDHWGHKYSDEAEIALEELVGVPAQGFDRPSGLAVGRIRQMHDAAEAYLDHLVRHGPQSARIDVTVDCANGAAAAIAPEAYRRIGARVQVVGGDLSGDYINCGVGATYPGFIASAVRGRLDGLGFAHDGDADRLIAVDETGRVRDGADHLAVLAIDRKGRQMLAHDTLVTTPVSNSGLAVSLRRYGIAVVESPIGDRNVLRTMLANGYDLGGEQYGHIIMLDQATTGDGILTAMALLDVMARSGQSLHELASAWTRVPQSVVNVPVSDRTILQRHPHLAALAAHERRRLGGGRLVVRMSTIEPVVRITCEAQTVEEAQSVTDRIVEAVQSVEAESGEGGSFGVGS